MPGKSGTRPKPSAQKELEGNPGHRPLPENEWKPSQDLPQKPSGLGRPASRAWDDLVVMLGPVITSVDGIGLEMICRTYINWRKHEKENDEPKADRAYKRLRSMLLEYGLTPASRTKVQSPKPPKKNSLKAFLENGNTGNQPN